MHKCKFKALNSKIRTRLPAFADESDANLSNVSSVSLCSGGSKTNCFTRRRLKSNCSLLAISLSSLYCCLSLFRSYCSLPSFSPLFLHLSFIIIRLYHFSTVSLSFFKSNYSLLSISLFLGLFRSYCSILSFFPLSLQCFFVSLSSLYCLFSNLIVPSFLPIIFTVSLLLFFKSNCSFRSVSLLFLYCFFVSSNRIVLSLFHLSTSLNVFCISVFLSLYL